jgi:hypothetical protein
MTPDAAVHTGLTVARNVALCSVAAVVLAVAFVLTVAAIETVLLRRGMRR